MARTFLISRVALAVALSSGMAMAVATPAQAAKKEKAGGANYSDAFRAAAGPLEKAMTEATSKLPSPPTPEALSAAKAQMDAALGGNAKAAFEAAIPTADDLGAQFEAFLRDQRDTD